MYHSRKTVHDMREAKRLGQKMTMLYVSTLDEADAAAQAGIDILSIESKYMSRAMREAAGDCFVQVGLIYGDLVTAEDYLREAFLNTKLGGDCCYCSASLDIQKTLSDNSIPVVGHVGLVPSQCTWTGGFKAAGKTAASAMNILKKVKQLEGVGCFAAELEVVPDRVGAYLQDNSSLLLFGMGAGSGADAQYLFTEDVLGHGINHKPRHAKTYRNFAAEFARLQSERIAAFKEFKADVDQGGYPGSEHTVQIPDDEFEAFLAKAEALS